MTRSDIERLLAALIVNADEETLIWVTDKLDEALSGRESN